MVLLMKWKYALAESLKWREYVSRELYYLWNRNTHLLIIKGGGNMSGMIVLLMKWTYAPAES